MIVLSSIWERDRSAWPVDTENHVFLARALSEVGKALYGEDWTGDEPRTRKVSPLPSDPEKARHLVQREVQRYLEHHHPQLAQIPVGGVPPFTYRFSNQGWEVASIHYSQMSRETHAACERFAGAVQKILTALTDGRLKSALRPLSGGAIGEALPESHWHTERGLQRILSCSLNGAQPFGSGKATHWIFITHESLSDFLRELKKKGSGKNNEVKKLQRWLSEWMFEHPDHRPPRSDGGVMSKDDIFEIAYEKFGVARYAFDTAWSDIHKQNPQVKWDVSGRPTGTPKRPRKKISK
jgi:hypothetical protein